MAKLYGVTYRQCVNIYNTTYPALFLTMFKYDMAHVVKLGWSAAELSFWTAEIV